MHTTILRPFKDYKHTLTGHQVELRIKSFKSLKNPMDKSCITRLINQMAKSPDLARVMMPVGDTGDCIEFALQLQRQWNDGPESEYEHKSATPDNNDENKSATPDNNDENKSISNAETFEQLRNMSLQTKENCEGQFRGYKCNVPINKNNPTCGLNTNFRCEKGSHIGREHCQSINGQCRLTATAAADPLRKTFYAKSQEELVHVRNRHNAITRPNQ